ncbi:hypothetical protein Plhal304r1_c089g0170921 [Plasmopara halstedii]
MADESIRNANHAVAQALAEVNRNTEKIKAIKMDINAIGSDIYAIEVEENFTGNEPRYKRLKARLKKANKRLTEAKDDLKEAKSDMILTVVENEHMNSIAQILDIDAWQVGGISIDICRVESDFPEWFYIRTETLDIIKVFKAQMEADLTLFLWAHVVWRVVLFRKVMGKGFSMLYMDGENEQYWRKDEASFDDLDLVENRDFELCLDGLLRQDIADNFARLARFRLLATSVQYPMKDDDMPVLRQCLVPFWSKCDLNAIGTHREWQEHEIKDKYFYSGGNLRDFLSERESVRSSISLAIREVEPSVAKLLDTQHGGAAVRQVDRLRMTGIPADDQRDLKMYIFSDKWICKITSEYALRRLGTIVQPSFYEVLWSKGRMLEDRDAMRAYDRAKARQHSYVALEFEAKSCRNDGMDAAECDTIMKQLSSSSDDYWYPSSRSLKTIDSVAKMTMPGQQNVVGLIQITKSDHHKIESEVLDKYAGFFPNGSRYIALVPDKETCDNFRLAPADPATKVPLDVAYITTWKL